MSATTTARHDDLLRAGEVVRHHPAVAECRVLWRGGELVAYVVPRLGSPFPEAAVDAFVREQLPSEVAPTAYVEICSLPLTADGAIDEEALSRITPFDPDLVQRAERKLQASCGSCDPVVVATDRQARRQAVHLSDLIPGGSGDHSDADGAPASEVASAAGGGAPAEAWGGPLTIPVDAPLTLSDALVRSAAQHANKRIVVVRADGSEATLTYGSLLNQARRALTGLRRHGIRAGDVAILQIPDLEEYFPVFWACVLGGVRPITVAVPSSYDAQNSIVQKLHHAWALTGHPPVIAGGRLVPPVAALRERVPMADLIVLSAAELAGEPAEDIHPSKPEDVVFYQLSSGSTGASKCIQITHRGIVVHAFGRQQCTGLAADDVTLNWLPMDHVAPLLMWHITDLYVGCDQVQAPGPLIVANPLRWLDLLERHRVTHTWSPNFGYKLVADALAGAGDRRWDLSAVKALVNGGEQVTVPVVRAFLEAVRPFGVKPASMQPVYGMAETCTAVVYETPFSFETSVRSLAKSSLRGTVREARDGEEAVRLVQCGPPAPGIAVRIADRDNAVVPERVIGRVQVKGDVTTPGYLNNEAANRETLVPDGWLNTGDLGFLMNGRLTITGREKELITVNGANYYCYDIEDALRSIPGIDAGCIAAAGVPDPSTGSEALAVFFAFDREDRTDRPRVVAAVRRELAAHVGLTPAYVVPVARSEFPKTTSGKIQRGRLKAALLAGEFAAVVKQIDVLLENSNTMPDWFHRRTWRRRQPDVPAAVEDPVVVFADDSGLGEQLASAWRREGVSCALVHERPSFSHLAPGEYGVDLTDEACYRRVFAALAADGFAPRTIVQVSGCAHLAAQKALGEVDLAARRISTTALRLVQALAAARTGETVQQLIVISRQTQAVVTGDRVLPWRSVWPALLKTAMAELPWLRCRHIDIDASPRSVALLRRACEWPGDEREVAIRDGEQWVPRLEAIDMGSTPADDVPLRKGGAYVLSGGAGGIGVEISKWLLTRFEANLLLVGRRPDDHPELAGVLAHLRRLPGNVRYVQADWSNAPSTAAAVERIRGWRPIDGVFHLAGSYVERPLVGETVESFEAGWRPKVLGAWALHQLIEQAPGTLFVSLSSVNGLSGSYGAGAYCAANAFLEALAPYQRQHGLRSHCFIFSRWDRVGMSRDPQAPEVIRSRGYYPIRKQQGVISLSAGLARDQMALYVGLDDTNRLIRRHLATANIAVRRLVAFVDGSLATELAAGEGLTVEDRAGRQVPIDVRDARELPRTADGEIDRAALGGEAHPGTVAPRTQFERLVSDVWCQVLARDAIGVHDNFFDLGGSSLDVARIAAELAGVLRRSVSTTDIYQHPTVAAQAAYLAGAESAGGSDDVTASSRRGEARRQVAKARTAVRASRIGQAS